MSKCLSRIDTEGRFRIPAELHEILGDKVIITNGLDRGYLCMYTPTYFDNIKQQLSTLNSMDANVRRVNRLIVGESAIVNIDSDHVIIVPYYLLERIEATVDTDLYIFVYDNKCEICACDTYAANVNEPLSVDNLSERYCVSGL